MRENNEFMTNPTKGVASVVWLVLVVVVVGTGYYASRHLSINWHDTNTAPVAHSGFADGIETISKESSDKSVRKLWVCPMHPQIIQDHPGACPICGMDLVESAAGHMHDAASGISVDTASVQRLGIRLATVNSKVISREVDTYGTVAINEGSIVNVSANTDGVLRKLYVDSVGQEVRAGQPLYEIYSQDLFLQQNEYIDLLNRQRQTLQSLNIPPDQVSLEMAGSKQGTVRENFPKQLSAQNAYVLEVLARDRTRLRDKLLFAGLSEEMLNRITKTGRAMDTVTVHATKSGFVTQIGARSGSTVGPTTNVVTTADLSTAWIDVALYPDQLTWAKEGEDAIITLPQAGEPPIKGKLRFVNPIIDPVARILHARVVVDNSKHVLHPGAFVDITILAKPHKGLLIPRSAILHTGKGDKVMLSLGNGHFLPVDVDTGIENNDSIEIADGLQEGAQVVVNGQFLLDAAASLSDTAQRMQSSVTKSANEK